MNIHLTAYSSIAEARADFHNKIDILVDDLRAELVPPGNYLQEEYTITYEAALAYKLDNNDVRSALSSWVEVTDYTLDEAADTIISARNTYVDLLSDTRRVRLKAKKRITDAITIRECFIGFDAAKKDIAETLLTAPPL